MKKLRLLLFEECNRKCVGCCNEDWDLANLEREDSFSNYDLIMLTGGEPMLRPDLIQAVSGHIITQNPEVPIYLYTAKVDRLAHVADVLPFLDGMTVTLHEQKDVKHFIRMAAHFELDLRNKDRRLNIFKGVIFADALLAGLPGWTIKRSIEWIKDAPLPKDEVLRRIV